MRSSLDTFGRKLSGTAIRSLREAKGFSERDLAHLIRREPAELRAVEEERKGLSMEYLIRMCRALECSVNDIAPKAP